MSDHEIVEDSEVTKQRQAHLNYQLPPVKQRVNAKHVSRACLNCRRRHFKCNGELPTCDKCLKAGTICTYVESNRGGSRKKGVSVRRSGTPSQRSKSNEGVIPDIEDLPSHRMIDDQDLYKLPCKGICSKKDCPGKYGRSEALSERKKPKIDCQCSTENNLSTSTGPPSPLKNDNFGLDIQNYENLLKIDFSEEDEILDIFYKQFYNAHPFIPPQNELHIYFQDPTIKIEMLHVMKVISEGQTSSKYAGNTPLISDRLVQCANLVKANNYNDIISLHSLLMISIIGHISALHDFSQNIRQYCIRMVEELGINIVDAKPQVTYAEITPSNSDSGFSYDANSLKLFASSRIRHIERSSIADSARRLFWELIFFDVITGSADGKTLTNLASIHTEIEYPTYPTQDVFDYKGRAEAALLVNKAIKLNLAIINRKPLEKHLRSLKVSLATMEMKIIDPISYDSPQLINEHGTVNEGVHQSIILFNYAKIFVHRPFSYLWKIKSPQIPKCNGEGIDTRDSTSTIGSEKLATIETQKTIDAADSIIKLLMDTNASKILSRTPLTACALALSSLVHLSAYIWVENLLKEPDKFEGSLTFNEDDLSIICDYIKMSLSAIFPITKHWTLSGRLSKHIRETVARLKPNLYLQIKNFLPPLEEKVKYDFDVLNSDKNGDLELVRASESSSNVLLSQGGSNNVIADEFTKFANNQSQMSDIIFNNKSNNFGLTTDDSNYRDGLPASETGCDWIDKALMDYFADEFPTFESAPGGIN